MATNLQSGKETQLALPLSTTDTDATLFSVPTVTSGRLFITDGIQRERVSYTGITGSKVTGLTRNLSVTGDPATGGTGLAFIAGSTVRLVAMHDQIVDKTDSNTFKAGTTQTFDALVSKDVSFTGTTTAGLKLKSLTTAQRTALTGANGMMVYDSDIGVVYQYIAGSRAQVAISGLTPMLLTGDQTASGIKTFSSLLKATDKQQFGGGAEVLDQITMGSGFKYGLGINGAKTVLYRNNLGAGVGFGSYDGTTYTEHASVNSATDFTFDGGNIRRTASDAEALAGGSTTTNITPFQLNIAKKSEVVSFSRATSGSQVVSHTLGKVPTSVSINVSAPQGDLDYRQTASRGFYDGTNNACSYIGSTSGRSPINGSNTSYSIYIERYQSSGSGFQQILGTISAITSTNFTITRTTGGNGGTTTSCIAILQ